METYNNKSAKPEIIKALGEYAIALEEMRKAVQQMEQAARDDRLTRDAVEQQGAALNNLREGHEMLRAQVQREWLRGSKQAKGAEK